MRIETAAKSAMNMETLKAPKLKQPAGSGLVDFLEKGLQWHFLNHIKKLKP